MTIIAKAEINVPLPPGEAFEAFVNFPMWKFWMPPTCRPLNGPDRPLEAGDQFAVAVTASTGRVFKFYPKVLSIDPGREIRWGGGPKSILHAAHSIAFEPDSGDGTCVVSTEPWIGLLTKIGFIGRFIDRESTLIMQAQLKGFRGSIVG